LTFVSGFDIEIEELTISPYAKPLPQPLPGTERGESQPLPRTLPEAERGESQSLPGTERGGVSDLSPCPLREGGRGVRSDA